MSPNFVARAAEGGVRVIAAALAEDDGVALGQGHPIGRRRIGRVPVRLGGRGGVPDIEGAVELDDPGIGDHLMVERPRRPEGDLRLGLGRLDVRALDARRRGRDPDLLGVPADRIGISHVDHDPVAVRLLDHVRLRDASVFPRAGHTCRE